VSHFSDGKGFRYDEENKLISIFNCEYYKNEYYLLDVYALKSKIIDCDYIHRLEILDKYICSEIPFRKISSLNFKSESEIYDYLREYNQEPKIDGIVAYENDKKVAYKIKLLTDITTDFYLKFVNNYFELYLVGDVKDIIKTKSFYNRNQRNFFLANLLNNDTNKFILFNSPYKKCAHIFYPRKVWRSENYSNEKIAKINSLMEKIMKSPEDFDDEIVEMSYAPDGWIPVSHRLDKIYPNKYITGLTNDSLIYAGGG
jgi:hypothetical protein